MLKGRKSLSFLGALLLNAPLFAYDTNKASYLGDVWTNFTDILQGTGGLIIAALLVLFGGYMIFRGNWIWGLLIVAGAVLVKSIPNIAQSMGFVF